MKKTGNSTKEVLQTLKKEGQEVTGKRLRRYLRQLEVYNDGKYTFYNFTEKEAKDIVKMVKMVIEKNVPVKEAMKEVRKKNKKKQEATTKQEA